MEYRDDSRVCFILLLTAFTVNLFFAGLVNFIKWTFVKSKKQLTSDNSQWATYESGRTSVSRVQQLLAKEVSFLFAELTSKGAARRLASSCCCHALSSSRLALTRIDTRYLHQSAGCLRYTATNRVQGGLDI